MPHKPSFQFYPGDWLKDTALRICSPAARGIWADMLMLLHECPQRGVFRAKNCSKTSAVSIKKISKSIAGCKPKMIQELIENGVVYVARKDGALYCKRLVRDELHRRHKATNGEKGGRKRQANAKQKAQTGVANPQANPGSSSSSSSSASTISKKKLIPIVGKNCHCGLPAVYRKDGEYDHFFCSEHMPERIKAKHY